MAGGWWTNFARCRSRIVSPPCGRTLGDRARRAVRVDADALVIGAGPAGSAAAIWLAQAGWRVTLVEQHAFPRQKVCGECISAGSLALLDELGVGAAFRRLAGPELDRVGWMSRAATVSAPFPPCAADAYRYGRALGRDLLDVLLLERARASGVEIRQPARVCAVRGQAGRFDCDIEARGLAVPPPGLAASPGLAAPPRGARQATLRARLVIDAHGSWEPEPRLGADAMPVWRRPRRGSDLFAFKASFRGSTLAPGLLPVLALDGGYGGIVVAEGGRTTLACCIRRDTLRAHRSRMPGAAAGAVVSHYLFDSCRGLREVLGSARRDGSWLTVGPLLPGMRVTARNGVFRVGNAAGETHPLIGEGISMALQSAGLLAGHLIRQPAASIDATRAALLTRHYATAWQSAFAPRLRLAAGYAHLALRPALAAPAQALLARWPGLMTRAARLAGKARRSVVQYPIGATP
jgi:flavin-dependent dehydrogenase